MNSTITDLFLYYFAFLKIRKKDEQKIIELLERNNCLLSRHRFGFWRNQSKNFALIDLVHTYIYTYFIWSRRLVKLAAVG